jgi:hypothetical protein
MKNQNAREGRDTDQSAPDPDQPDRDQDRDQDHKPEQGKGHGPLKGTDTAATTDLEYAERERGKRTTM